MSSPRKKTRRPAQLNMLIDPELRQWAKKYARQQGTTVTQIIVRHLLEVRDRARGNDIEQI